jgi:transposase
MNNAPTLGIDIALQTFFAALRYDDQRIVKREFSNNSAGFRKLQSWLKQHFTSKVRAALESTNVYGDALAQFLYDKGHEVFVLNPEHVAGFAISRGRRNCTDSSDAVIIAEFIATRAGTPWLPPPPEQKDLRSLTRVRRQLVAHRVELQNQLRTTASVARPYLDASLRMVRKQIKAVERDIAQHLAKFPVLGAQVRRLMTCRGIGLVTAAVIIAELPPITPKTDPRTIAGWAGLTPTRSQSGPKEWRTRLSRKGNEHIRQALYMPSLVAKRCNPIIRAFVQRLAENKKTKTAILGAISHKLIRICIGMLRSNRDFDQNWSPQKN